MAIFKKNDSRLEDFKSRIVDFESESEKKGCSIERKPAPYGYEELLNEILREGSQGLPLLLSVLKNSAYTRIVAAAAERAGKGCAGVLNGEEPNPYTREEAENSVYPALARAAEKEVAPVKAAALEALWRYMLPLDRDRITRLVTSAADYDSSSGLRVRCCRLLRKSVPNEIEQDLILRYDKDEFCDAEDRRRDAAMSDSHGRGMTELPWSTRVDLAAVQEMWSNVLKIRPFPLGPVVPDRKSSDDSDKQTCHMCSNWAYDTCNTCNRPACAEHRISGHVELYHGVCHACWYKEIGEDTPPP